MRRRSRLRRWLKWSGVAICLAMAAAWGISLPLAACYLIGSDAGDRAAVGIILADGCLDCWLSPFSRRGEHTFSVDPKPWRAPYWSPRLGDMDPSGKYVLLPLWIPFLLVAIPTGIIFWRDRRRIPPGHCLRCGYSLTGNKSGVCPECGTGVGSKPAAAGAGESS
jgi:hypothetical protein